MAKIRWVTIAAILIVVLSFTMPFVPAHTALANGIPTVYVSGTSGNDAWDGSSALYTGGTVGPKKTIWAGFTAVSTGGSIRVAAGTYAEHALTFDRTVAIMGTGPQYTIIDASSGNWNAIQASGGIGGTVWLIGVTIQNGNYTTGPGGVMVNSPWTVMMVDCIIKNNTGRDGGGICVYSDATLDMNRCTVSGNHATKPGYTGGGGIYSEGTATLTNCTISGNDATGWGGGLRNSAGASMTLTNCTVAYNGVYGGAGLGGGFYNGGAGPVIGVMTFKNTIVANNNASSSGANGYTTAGAAVNSLGYNLDSENSCGFNQASDQRNTNPLLGPLQDNGYCTFTCAITASSPAYNKGTNTGAPATDQRLVPRPQDTTCDIGAYELAQASATTATGTGTAWFSTINGYITGLTAAATTPCGTLPGFSFPHGFFSFNITNLTPGATAIITITLPSNMPVGTQYWKCINGHWVNCSSLLGSNDGDNIITLTITDGGLGDADGQANGIIVDPGGPVVPVQTPPAPRVSPTLPTEFKRAQMSLQYLNISPQQTSANQPVTILTNVVNTGDEAGSLNVALKINGQVEQTKMVSLGPQATQPIKFTVTKAQPGTYAIDIGGQTSSFTILGASSTATSKSANAGMIVILVFGVLVLIAVVAVLLARRPA